MLEPMFSVPCGLCCAARTQEQAPDLHGTRAQEGAQHPIPDPTANPQPPSPPHGSACFPSPLACYQWLRSLPPVAVRPSMADAYLIDVGFPQE